MSGTSYFGELHDPVLKRFWNESLSELFNKNRNTKFRKATLKKLMSLNGVSFFLTSYWLFFYIAILKTFFETYS